MKKSELGVIAVIAIISITAAYFVGQSVLGKVVYKGVSVETMPRISKDVVQPSGTVFYDDAKNPTVQITIGGSSNQQPLNGGQ